ncbi:MAG: hypothetical protein AAFZ07_19520 [Actinomycetota bacterium]
MAKATRLIAQIEDAFGQVLVEDLKVTQAPTLSWVTQGSAPIVRQTQGLRIAVTDPDQLDDPALRLRLRYQAGAVIIDHGSMVIKDTTRVIRPDDGWIVDTVVADPLDLLADNLPDSLGLRSGSGINDAWTQLAALYDLQIDALAATTERIGENGLFWDIATTTGVAVASTLTQQSLQTPAYWLPDRGIRVGTWQGAPDDDPPIGSVVLDGYAQAGTPVVSRDTRIPNRVVVSAPDADAPEGVQRTLTIVRDLPITSPFSALVTGRTIATRVQVTTPLTFATASEFADTTLADITRTAAYQATVIVPPDIIGNPEPFSTVQLLGVWWWVVSYTHQMAPNQHVTLQLRRPALSTRWRVQ